MKHLIAFGFLFLIGSFNLYAQQPANAGLENWQSFGNFEVPDSFYTFDQTLFLGNPTTSKTTDAHSGQFAALVETQAGPSTTNFTGSLSYGSISTGTVNYFYGWPFAARPTKLKFWYKYTNAGADTAFAGVILTKWNGTHTTLGTGFLTISTNVSAYTLAEIPINYVNGQTPDTINLGFMSSYNSSPTPGASFYIDDISLDYTTAINSLPDAGLMAVYPNPFSDYLFIDHPSPGTYTITVSTLPGRQCFKAENVHGSYKIDGSPFGAGLYCIRITDAFSSFTYKVMKAGNP